MKFRWFIAPPQPLLADRLAAELRISSLLAQCLINRGISDARLISEFLDPRLRHLSDPFLLPQMESAVERLFRARERDEALVVFGDYDVDGVTSTALLLEVFEALGWKAHAYLPNRMDEGYGLSQEGVDNCLKKFPVSLLLAIDCGSTAVQTIDALRARNVDVIVVDHHQ
ncbi:MAG TPA: DHH family phosphoesterase, partial [Verrucomicrobiota bacterium]|nr:DHH family phosphoesterase [Verrucomicrobiota bacterium]